ncbi:MAG: GWxTD domain-containing protein [Candidatus Coatesbacteria bacterium]|nr:GWxTD domain-containing protein [Candidatus Coatesbacteria bacterium]
MKHHIRLFVILSILAALPAAADFGPVANDEGLEFQLDSCQFLGNSGTLVELYLQVPNRGLEFLAEDPLEGPWWATYVVKLELLDDAGQVIYRDTWSNDIQAVAEEQTVREGSFSLDVVRLDMDPGLYEVRLTLGDPNSEDMATGTALLPLEVADLSTAALSPLQVSSNIRLVDTENFTTVPIGRAGLYLDEVPSEAVGPAGAFSANDEFIKLDKFVAPLPSRTKTGSQQDLLYFYGELYTSGEYSLAYEVYNAPGSLLSDGETAVDADGMNSYAVAVDTAGWSDGEYRLEIELRDASEAVLAESGRDFTIGVGAETVEVVADSGEPMTDEELRRFIREVGFIASERELNDLTGAPADKRWLLVERFWAKRDPDPATPTNEFKIEYYNRLAYVRDHYGRGYGDGLDSDRGRVYMIYGPPDEVEDTPLGSGMIADRPTESGISELEAELDVSGTKGVSAGETSDMDTSAGGELSSNILDLEKPHLLWIYYRSGGESQMMKFLFEDRTGYGDYDIVWSTERGQY